MILSENQDQDHGHQARQNKANVHLDIGEQYKIPKSRLVYNTPEEYPKTVHLFLCPAFSSPVLSAHATLPVEYSPLCVVNH